MYCIDELLNSQYEHRDHKQATKSEKFHTYNMYLFHDKYVEIAC